MEFDLGGVLWKIRVFLSSLEIDDNGRKLGAAIHKLEKVEEAAKLEEFDR
jgi:hypothetical protein